MYDYDNFSEFTNLDDADGIDENPEDYFGLYDNEPAATLPMQQLDVDNDGFYETTVFIVDADQNGYYDSVQTISGFDTDDNGVIDSFIESIDFGADNQVDIVNIAQDLDQDNVFETFESISGEELNDLIDNVMNEDDIKENAFDTDDDIEDIPDNINIDDELDDVNDDELDDMNDDDFFDDDEDIEELNYDDMEVHTDGVEMQNFDPDNYDPDSVIGDPAQNMENWHQQSDASSCAVVAQEFVLENVTGQEFTEEELCEFAMENGWFTPGANGGTLPYDVGNILEASGMTVIQSSNNDINHMAEVLQNGGNVIVGIDANEIWEGDNDTDFAPGMEANHALQVIGIDYSNPDAPMVIVNDSGIQDGCGAMIPLDVFEDAWEDSGFFMVEAYS